MYITDAIGKFLTTDFGTLVLICAVLAILGGTLCLLDYLKSSRRHRYLRQRRRLRQAGYRL